MTEGSPLARQHPLVRWLIGGGCAEPGGLTKAGVPFTFGIPKGVRQDADYILLGDTRIARRWGVCESALAIALSLVLFAACDKDTNSWYTATGALAQEVNVSYDNSSGSITAVTVGGESATAGSNNSVWTYGEYTLTVSVDTSGETTTASYTYEKTSDESEGTGE